MLFSASNFMVPYLHQFSAAVQKMLSANLASYFFFKYARLHLMKRLFKMNLQATPMYQFSVKIRCRFNAHFSWIFLSFFSHRKLQSLKFYDIDIFVLFYQFIFLILFSPKKTRNPFLTYHLIHVLMTFLSVKEY